MWAKPFLQSRPVFIGIPRAVVGVGEPLSAAQAGFLQKFPEVCLAWAQPLLQPRLVLPKFLEVCLAWAKPFQQHRLVFTGTPRPVNKENEPFYAAQAALDLN